MKILHLSDLHIGLKLHNRDLAEDQRYVFRQIIKRAKEQLPQAIVIAGDIYDRAVPSAEAVDFFDWFISSMTEASPKSQIMIISGNHDSGSRLNVFRSVLQKRNIHMIGRPPEREADTIEKVVVEDAYGPVNFYLLPFVKPSMVRKIIGTDSDGRNFSYNTAFQKLLQRENINTSERNILVSHQFFLPPGKKETEIERMDSEIITVGNIDQIDGNVLEIFDYAALGHIHKPMRVGSAFYRYCGTPMAYSVSEAGQEKGAILVSLGEKGDIESQVLPLQPLHQVKVIEGSFHDVLKQGCDDYVTVVLTDKKDLDVIDMQQQIRYKFPNLLEIRRKQQVSFGKQKNLSQKQLETPMELCVSFLEQIGRIDSLEDKQKQLLEDVIDTIKEAK